LVLYFGGKYMNFDTLSREELLAEINILQNKCNTLEIRLHNSLVDITNQKKVELDLRAKNAYLEEISKNDGLTELLNHNRIFFELEEQINLCKKNNLKLSIIMLDLDHFKEINDEYGHLVGDEVLALVGETIKRSIRDTDFAGRYGGEEFLIILPDTDLEKAIVIADRIRSNVEKIEVNEKLKVTISGGIKQLDEESILEYVKSADALLYKAKHGGRNRIEK
jgi:diguanylate cyclase (GGDEF)-like protein